MKTKLQDLTPQEIQDYKKAHKELTAVRQMKVLYRYPLDRNIVYNYHGKEVIKWGMIFAGVDPRWKTK
jgi:hypothetical protein